MNTHIGIEKALLAAEPTFYNKYAVLKERLLSQEYEYAMAKFPGANQHGPGHIRRVLDHLGELLGNNPLDFVNAYELFIAMMAVLYHDVGLLKGRPEHPETSGYLLSMERNDYLFDELDREFIDAAVRSHGSGADIEQKCQHFSTIEKVRGCNIRPRTLALLLRSCDCQMN